MEYSLDKYKFYFNEKNATMIAQNGYTVFKFFKIAYFHFNFSLILFKTDKCIKELNLY